MLAFVSEVAAVGFGGFVAFFLGAGRDFSWIGGISLTSCSGERVRLLFTIFET